MKWEKYFLSKNQPQHSYPFKKQGKNQKMIYISPIPRMIVTYPKEKNENVQLKIHLEEARGIKSHYKNGNLSH